MVHSTGSPSPALGVGDFADLEIASRAATTDLETEPLVLLTNVHESENAGEKAGRGREVALPQTDGVQSADLLFYRNRTFAPRSEVALIPRFVHDERQTMRIGERERRGSTSGLDLADGEMVLRQSLSPVVDAAERNGERDFHRQPHPRLGPGHLRPREEGDVGSRVAFPVGVEEVIGSG